MSKMNERLSGMREDIAEIFQAGLKVVAPQVAINKFCELRGNVFRIDKREYDLDTFTRIVVLGAGKAGASMAAAIENILGSRIDEGLVVVKYGHVEPLSRVRIVEAGHPVPDANGYRGAKAMYDLALTADKYTLVICLISGGGSALMPFPVTGVSLEDKQETTGLLLGCGATIHEMNTVRKHLSKIKGGGLAKAVFPATLACLILSDVVGDDLDSIASGPCTTDTTTFSDSLEIIKKYQLQQRIPQSVKEYLVKGIGGEVEETAKPGEELFEDIHNVIVASNFEALYSSKIRADELGYNTLLLSSSIEGETRDVADFHMALAREIITHNYPVAMPACLLSGGETTVSIKGKGKGGRNQEFALATALKMRDMENTVVLSAGTDGNDGPTDAAGAIADSSLLKRAEEADLNPAEYLENNDAYHFFDALGDLYKTGPTNTNVMDIRIILVDSIE